MKVIIIGPIPNEYFFENGLTNFKQDSHPAYWMSNLLNGYSSKYNIDLFYITTSKYVSKDERFQLNGITFFVIKRGIPFLNKGYPFWFKLDTFTNYFNLRKKYRKIVNEINPDIINSHGTEYVNSLILNDVNFNSVVTIQGIVNFWKHHDSNSFVSKQAQLENQVFNKQCNYIVPDIPSVRSYILSQNVNAKFFHGWYPVDKLAFNIPSQTKNADIVFASRVEKAKGIFDILVSTQIIRNSMPDVKLKIIGMSNDKLIKAIHSKIIELGIESNVDFIGFIPNKGNFYQEIKRSKILVLPSHFDVAPSVIRESMALGVPVVAYETDGIPFLLEHGKCGLLVEKYNTNQLASQILKLLHDKDLYSQLKVNAEQKAYNEFTSDSCFSNYYNCYQNILNKENMK